MNSGPAVVVASLLNFMFFGALVVQVYIYSFCFPRDSLTIKCIVYFVFLAVTACVVLNGWDIAYWLALDFGDAIRLTKPRHSPFFGIIMPALIGTVVQCFFCYRIIVIKRAAWPMALLIALFSLAQCAIGMVSGIYTFTVPVSRWYIGVLKVVPTWLAGTAIVDILIAVTMTYLLLGAAERVHASTQGLLKDLVRLIIETNTLTAVAAILGLALFLAFPDTGNFVAPTWDLAGIYANTMLTILNNRAVPRSATPETLCSQESAASTVQFRTPIARTETQTTGVDCGTEMTFATRSSGGFKRNAPATTSHQA
ncbi:hypothetical protein B0H15DRAFT_31674 [Mycena belliarum]|uniref:DUF6534 domain-containing protein n=1 Tax=Mycena belliarum TaxID=1033014 RepID=A0AAD6UFC9_9AGAR|nr:hypothetical protein B0H15DRAFT_31674 [Mycena belliae]